MAKPLKFYQTLNQVPKGPKHGKHRRAGTQAHGNPIVGTDHGTGWSSWPTVTWNTGFVTWDSSIREPEPQPIPYAGIRTGELIGTRAWLVINDHELRSLAHHFVWEPGQTVSGDISKQIDDPWSIFIGHPIMGGVYAHHDMPSTMMDIAEEWSGYYPFKKNRDKHGSFIFLGSNDAANDEVAYYDNYLGVAVGTVKMWGEIVEHERGYRAQYAKIVSIDEVCGVVDIEKLRAKYLIG